MPRYAAFLVPPAAHPLWATGNSWLGRDPAASPTAWGPPPAQRREPWRYGFHATLKAPMRLALGATEAELLDAVDTLVAAHPSFEMPPLSLAWLGSFLALRPAQEPSASHRLRRLADDAVRRLDPLRAPFTEADRARYLPPNLNPRQRSHAERWGYAHVMDDWRCHFTLSDPFVAGAGCAEAQALQAAAQAHFAPALSAAACAFELALFVEPERGEPLALRRRWALPV